MATLLPKNVVAHLGDFPLTTVVCPEDVCKVVKSVMAKSVIVVEYWIKFSD